MPRRGARTTAADEDIEGDSSSVSRSLLSTSDTQSNSRRVNRSCSLNLLDLVHFFLVLAVFLLAAMELCFYYTFEASKWWYMTLALPLFAVVRLLLIGCNCALPRDKNRKKVQLALAFSSIVMWTLVMVFLIRFQGTFTSNALSLFEHRFDNNWPSMLDPRLSSGWMVIMSTVIVASWNEFLFLAASIFL